jgi:hypothetical protein
VLTDRKLLSDRQARTRVAELLADVGYSLRKGDHQESKRITGSAIRNWRDKSEQYPLHNEIVKDMIAIHTSNLARRSASTLDDVLAYFRHQAGEAVRHARSL